MPVRSVVESNSRLRPPRTRVNSGHLDIAQPNATDQDPRSGGFSTVWKLILGLVFGVVWLATWVTAALAGGRVVEASSGGGLHLLIPGFLGCIVVGAGVYVATRRLWTYLLVALVGGASVGYFAAADSPRMEIIETLRNPHVVLGWSTSGLELEDGRTISLPGIAELPESSAMLPHLLSSGVEIDPAGRVYGLIRVHHWCGNDPVGKHLAKVDIARVLEFVGEVGSSANSRAPWLREMCTDVGEAGWRTECYERFTREQDDATRREGEESSAR